MCGIIAFLGHVPGVDMAYSGLLILRNRGYDGAGVCSFDDGKFLVHKFATTPALDACTRLKDYLLGHKNATNIIGHSRWATHGSSVLDANSHPHVDFSGKFSLVHNGIIENYATLKQELVNKG